jgi:hemolysin activation/secretion protein
MSKRLFVFSFFLLAALPLTAAPPPLPSAGAAGVVERQLEKEYEGQPLEPTREIPSIQIDIPEEKLEMPEGKKVFITGLEIHGNVSLSTKELLSLIEGNIGQELSIKDIYRMCQLIDKYYAQKGYFLARCYPPLQEISKGTLCLEIIEGKLGKVSVEGAHRYSDKFIQSYFSSLIGQPLQYDAFLRQLMLLNENSDLAAAALFEKGKEVGTADVILRVKDHLPLHLYLNANDYGRFLTTNTRLGGRLDAGNLLAYGDKLSFAGVVGFPVDALDFIDAIYRIPLNRKGTFMEWAYLSSKFHVEELKELNIRGRSDIATLKVSHALTRRKFLNMDVFGSFDYKQIRNFALGHTTSYDKLRLVTLGIILDHADPSQGRDYLVTRMGVGIPSILGGLRPHDPECSRLGGGGRFIKFIADYDRIQKLMGSSFFYFHLTGQWSPNKLTLPEQLYIGGIDTVRGFPLGNALGDSGYYTNLELRVPVPFLAKKRFFMAKRTWEEMVQLIGFLDHGGVFLHEGTDFFEWGTGFGIRVNHLPFHCSGSFDVGFPLNHKERTHNPFLYFKVTGRPF